MIWAMFLSVCFGLVMLATVYCQLSDFGQCLQLFFCFGFAILVIVTVVSNLVFAIVIISPFLVRKTGLVIGFVFADNALFCQVHIWSHDFGHIFRIGWPHLVVCVNIVSHVISQIAGHIIGHTHIFGHVISYIAGHIIGHTRILAT